MISVHEMIEITFQIDWDDQGRQYQSGGVMMIEGREDEGRIGIPFAMDLR
jgi:hypothetical protein